ncbi:MAG TPA: CSLREA domain-containing protein, partial [Rubrobacter sp.]
MINTNFIGAPRRVFGFGLAVMVAFFIVLLAPSPAHAITVNSTADPGTGGCNSAECTLREAIDVSNGLLTTETIEFDIPDNPAIAGPEVKTISPSSQLPSITDNVTINGYTQAGSVVNSASTNASSAVLKIQLSGLRPNGSRLAASGLTIETSSCLIKGLAINRFGQHGVLIRESSTDTATGNKLEGNFIGTDPGGTIDRGNGADGVHIESADNVIGGPANLAQNVISVNDANGVTVDGESATASGNVISNNHIGTDADAAKDLG